MILITGASNGLGAALIRYFSSKAFAVIICDVLESDAESLYKEIVANVGEGKVMKCIANVADRAQVRAMFDSAVEKFGNVDVLINCAGINRDAPFTKLTDELWDAVISVHLKGHFICCQEYVLHNPDKEGLIINLGAACGQIGRKNGANFCSAKGAIFALTKCMALELAPRIRVNCLVPNAIRTREVMERYNLGSKKGLEKELATMPMGRLGEFEDVNHMVECIINAKFSTGATFYVNGGQYMH